MFSNGLSLMHGHGHPPITEALHAALGRGTAWPGASDAQIAFAELLCERLAGAERVRFANTGTEATMLGVKLARAVTGRSARSSRPGTATTARSPTSRRGSKARARSPAASRSPASATSTATPPRSSAMPARSPP